jgi:hypothetical protein
MNLQVKRGWYRFEIWPPRNNSNARRFLFVFNEKQPAVAGPAEFTLTRSEWLGMTSAFHQPLWVKG